MGTVKSNKVYCKNCTHHFSTDDCRYYGFFEECLANKNNKDFYGDIIPEDCSEKNENTDCKEYKKTWWKFWVKE